MATFFGEILEPTSRALFDDFSDDEEEIKPKELRLQWFQTQEIVPSFLDTFFVYHGKLSVAFAEAYLIAEKSVPAGEITTEEKNEDEENDIVNSRKKSLPSRIYLDDNVATCLISPTCSSEMSFQFAKCISALLKVSKRVIIFTDESYNNYKTAFLRDLPPVFMRELKTSHNNQDYIVKELPVPNIIAGIPAAIASWCQIFDKNSRLFICYTDQQKLDSVTAAPYVEVIKKINEGLIKNSKPDFSRKKFYGNPDVIGGSSNIYI